jgi:hypothetical protein
MKEAISGKKRKAVIYLTALSIVCGLIIWHAVQWHLNGMYLEMFGWLQTGQGYLTVLYNLGLMLVLGTALGFLMEQITNLIGYRGRDGKKQ